ncbi:MAG: alpha-glucan family phosphorylase [Deltaproteobacteria bacterium]
MSNDQTPASPLVAYFCMEYGLHPEFPIYAGGLGILAGDHIKSAGQLGLPLVAVGLLWRGGYSHQRIGEDGVPIDSDDARDLGGLLEPTSARFTVPIEGREIPCHAWKVVRYGNAPLYLLEPVDEADRWITRRLYCGGPKDRVAQEILLGVGGVRALRALGIRPEIFHFNEGHAVFAGLELIAEETARGRAFSDGWAAVRPQIVFTTHTPVEAGNESHSLDLLMEMGANRGARREEMERLGGSPFNMTVAGLRLSCRANAVSALHAETARAMWRDVSGAARIEPITNGVHPGTWQDERVRGARGPALWAAHQQLKGELLLEVSRRTGTTLDPNRLLVGFARRAAAYKRSDLILRKAERIAPLLERGDLQVLFSGKAHPQDEVGRQIVGNLVRMARAYPKSVLFLPDYDMRLGQLLTRGCDVWLNNPRRPLEASGTSGMKAAMNGVLNVSVLDGWWPEGCEHGVNGWQIGEGIDEPDHQRGDERDMEALYRLIEQEVVPRYADQARWTGMMGASIEMAEWRFSSHRMVREYFSSLYRAPTVEQRATG